MKWLYLLFFIISLYLLAKYEDKIGKNSNLYYILLMIILFIIGIILWNILGFDFGSGGSPYGDPDLYFNE